MSLLLLLGVGGTATPPDLDDPVVRMVVVDQPFIRLLAVPHQPMWLSPDEGDAIRLIPVDPD